jgi:hypothetical protein
MAIIEIKNNVYLFQSPNGVWNIFGGKLAWGPEAIVCDDPNFQGRGNPSSGIFIYTY